LHFNFIVAAHLVSALHSSVLVRLASGAFYETIFPVTFCENVNIEIQNKFEIQTFKKANKEKAFEFDIFGFVSKFGFRASDLKSALFVESFDAILCPT